MMHGGVSSPSCCAFTHRVAFEEVSGHRVLLKSGPGNRGIYDITNHPVRRLRERDTCTPMFIAALFIPPIPRSALEKDPMPGHLFEGNPVPDGPVALGPPGALWDRLRALAQSEIVHGGQSECS